jgi:hypothetical protein
MVAGGKMMTSFDPLSYLLDLDTAPMHEGRIFELSYDSTRGGIAYGNLRDEKGRFHSLSDANRRGRYAPYLPPDDITDDYGEYCPDPRFEGYLSNIDRQVARRKAQQIPCMEFDNPDTPGLSMFHVLRAHDRAHTAGLTTVAKNPILVNEPERYLAHPSIAIAICEHDTRQGSDAMDELRRAVAKPLLPVRFVAFVHEDENGTAWAHAVADNIRAKGYRNMGVTISRHGEYNSVEDLMVPVVS